MGCNCKWCEAVIAVIIFLMAMWPQWFGANVSKWIVVIAAVVLFVHSWMCKSCMMCDTHKTEHKKRKR